MAERVPAGTDGSPADDARPTVIVYTHSLLERSMTFIRSHAEALTRYRPVYAGAHRVAGLELPAGRTVTVNEGGLRGRLAEYLFRRFGVAGRATARLRRFAPAVLHAHFGSSGPSALTLADALGIPLVVTYHGQDATITDSEARRSWRGREYLRGRAQVMERASIVIAVSDFIRSRLIAKGYPAHKIVTHYNGIDLAYFRRGAQSREPVVVFVGRFVEKKGCEYLIRALAQLRSQGLKARGVLVGDGPLRSGLERLADESGAQVDFTGFLPLSEVKDWLARASVVAVPSVTASNGDSEGLPTVILEAQAMGTPVIVTRHAGNVEGVSAGRTALVVGERDVGALADAVRFFLQDGDAVERFGAAGRAFVESRFGIAGQARGLEDLYDRARAKTS
jgi:colanic acid/amylovoran biosynthesis glycosyltransferase